MLLRRCGQDDKLRVLDLTNLPLQKKTILETTDSEIVRKRSRSVVSASRSLLVFPWRARARAFLIALADTKNNEISEAQRRDSSVRRCWTWGWNRRFVHQARIKVQERFLRLLRMSFGRFFNLSAAKVWSRMQGDSLLATTPREKMYKFSLYCSRENLLWKLIVFFLSHFFGHE